MIFLSLYVFLRFLTWRARHSQPLFATRICFLCNQRAFVCGDGTRAVLSHGEPVWKDTLDMERKAN